MTSETRLGNVVGRGMTWAALGTIWSKGASFAAQIVLGYLLTKSEWGVYAIAISVASFVMVFRDGGVRELLVQRGPKEFPELRQPVFWIAVAINLGIAGVLAVGAVAAEGFYQQPGVRNLIWVLAATVLLDTPAQFLRAKLRIDLKFATFARLDIASATIRYGGAIALAALDFGPMSFVLPLPFVSLFEWIVLTVVTRENVLRYRPLLRRWRALFHEVKWLLLGTVVVVFSTMGDYAVLGRLVAASVVGSYYFAFQLAVHASMLAAANVNTVLMPAFARVGDDLARQARAAIRGLRALALVASPLSLGLAVIIDPLELFIWDGKWRSAVGAVQFLSVMLPIRLSFMISTSSLKGRGEFRRWAVLALVQGVGLMIVAAAAGAADLSAAHIAAVISGYWLLASVLTLIAALWGLVSVPKIASALLPSWLIACGSAAAAFAMDELVVSQYAPLPRALILGSIFSVLFLAASRLLIAAHLRDTLSVLPRALARPVSALLRLG